MIENMKRRLATVGIVTFMMLGSLGAPLLVSAESPVDPSNFGYKEVGQYYGQANGTNFTNLGVGAYKDPRELARNIINIILGFLGIIAVVFVLFAGFQWMNAGGEEEKVKEAQQRL
ncbi:MAG: hypothetical protein Q8P56_01970, partial [Candidatus Uhrbacteria bacterium]|nr:hypothetical protein [Candidatus Uhrbacteria bacterium]